VIFEAAGMAAHRSERDRDPPRGQPCVGAAGSRLRPDWQRECRSETQDRANAAGFRGKAAETVAINPAIAISSLELVNQWYYNPDDMAIIRDCANTAIGVWSDNSLDRTVVMAVYGQPAAPTR
jgi:hypothetical protein